MTERVELPTAEMTRRLYDLLAARDLSGYFEMLADDVVFHIGGQSIVAGEYRGKESVAQLGMRVMEETEGTFQTQLLSVLANGSHATTLHRWSADRRGRHIEMNNFNVYRFVDGFVAERWEFLEDQNAHDVFWSA